MGLRPEKVAGLGLESVAPFIGIRTMMEFLEVIHENMPRGCVFSLYNRKPRIVFIAGVSRNAISEIEHEQGLRIAA